MNTRNIVLWVHIIVALVTIGPFLLFDIITPGLVRTGNVPFLQGLERLTKVLGPSTMVIALAGIVLVIDNDGYHFKQGWIIGALVGYVLMVAIGMGVLSKSVTRAIEHIEAGQDVSAEVTRLTIFGALNTIVILGIVWLMVAKPGL